ncbi:MAG: hypothetical protein IPK19_39525 [Chloroflexi bacterium]|nr:hypothetical protein [Chloroflexota bacterium]
MSASVLLNWLILAASLFNTAIMLWLGLTVLLNAERYTGGVWLMGGGMLAGAAFFVSHTAILGQELTLNPDGLNFWWRLGWVPVVIIPLAWYVVILWYSGFWTRPRPLLFFRHRWPLTAALILTGGLAALLLLTNLLPDYEQIVTLDLTALWQIGGVPAAFVSLPVVMVGCIALSIDALRHPAPTDRLMGDLARSRSRPWLMRAAAVLLLVALLVTGFIVGVVGESLTLTPAPSPAGRGRGEIETGAVGMAETAQNEVLSAAATPPPLLSSQAEGATGGSDISDIHELYATGSPSPRLRGRGGQGVRGYVSPAAPSQNSQEAQPFFLSFEGLALFDLALSLLIAAATFCIGQAIVAYEVFTGTTLPRRGFFRQWRNMLIFAAVYALFLGWSLATGFREVYTLLATTLLLIGFIGVYNWRTFVERDRTMRQLRPFVASQRLLTGFTGEDEAGGSGAADLFVSIARDLLHAERAVLVPLGDLAPLVGEALRYPSGSAAAPLPPLPDLTDRLVHLDRAAYAGCRWAIPLRSERGLVGALLIGGKADGGLYSQEEIELAAAGGERALDTLAGEHLARRLMTLQRDRLAETRVVDLRTRRALHDEVLPALHTAILSLSAAADDPAAREDALRSLAGVHKQIAGLIRQTESAPVQVGGAVDLAASLRRMVEGEFEGAFSALDGDLPTPLLIPPLAGEVVLGAAREAVRNAALHARGESPDRSLRLTVRASEAGGQVTVTIEDDGVGFYARRGESVGTGNGLLLHSTLLTVIGGSLRVEAPAEGGTRVVIETPE